MQQRASQTCRLRDSSNRYCVLVCGGCCVVQQSLCCCVVLCVVFGVAKLCVQRSEGGFIYPLPCSLQVCHPRRRAYITVCTRAPLTSSACVNAVVQVGLTNMNVEAVSAILDAGVPVANNQVGCLGTQQCGCDRSLTICCDAMLCCAAHTLTDWQHMRRCFLVCVHSRTRPQVQFSLLDRRPLNGMLDLCMSKGIKVGREV